MMTPRRTLTEAKTIGGHASAKNPWKHHAIVATVSAALRPSRGQALRDVGQRMVYPRFARLEASFRRELEYLFEFPSDYNNRKMKRIFRKYYVQAFQLGQLSDTGAFSTRMPTLKPEDKRWLETFLTKEYGYWAKFVKDIKGKKGKVNHEKRLEMYVQTLRSMYNSSRVIANPPTTIYFWETTPAEHCPHCLYLQLKSPFIKENLPTVPAAGDTQCLSNCRCHLRIEQVSAARYLKVKKNAPTRQEVLRGMRAFKN
jgi:hypothetical protein